MAFFDAVKRFLANLFGGSAKAKPKKKHNDDIYPLY